VAAKKKSSKKPPSTPAMRKLTEQEYARHFRNVGATLADAVRAVERLELDLKRIKSKLACFRDPYCPIYGSKCSTYRKD
jgi:hypothetical protein